MFVLLRQNISLASEVGRRHRFPLFNNKKTTNDHRILHIQLLHK